MSACASLCEISNTQILAADSGSALFLNIAQSLVMLITLAFCQ